MKKMGKRFTSILLVLILLFSSVFTANVVRAEEEEGDDTLLTWEVVENDPELVSGFLNKTENKDEPEETLRGNVRVSIVLDGRSTMDSGYSKDEIALDPDAVSYRDSLKKTQDDMAAVISRDVLNGEALDVVWNLTLAANIISANVPAEKIDEIKALDGVKDVVLETQYYPQEDEILPDDPNMSVATDMTSTNEAWAAGYTGAGSKIAIVDTGLDIDHQSFDGKALEVAISEIEIYEGKEIELMNASDVAHVWNQLNASQRNSGSPSNTYVNAKVPYAFNYVDRNFNVTHLNDTQGEHGSHVAGIAAANKYIRVSGKGMQDAIEAVRTHGNAPDAQLLVMKVFGRGGGAYDSDYFAAIEDAIVLGADSVNLSLGSSSAGFVNNSTYQEIIDGLTDVDIIWANSAGNNDAWPNNLTTNSGVNYLYSDGVNFATGGSPATYANTMSVASVDNDGFTGASMVLDGRNIYFTETSGYGNPALTTIGGDYEFVFVDGPGVDDNNYANNVFAALGSDIVAGKIAFCRRGSSSFFAKANAAAQQGAAAVIVVNNQPGTISMNLSGYNYDVPVVSITESDGALVLGSAEKMTTEDGVEYYVGTISVGSAVGTIQYHSEYYTMSSFSSWGAPGDLGIKPEITTPGGNIYSVFGLNQGTSGEMVGGHDMYENMSGTSMASPQLAGIAAVMAQYVKENGLDEQAERLDLTRRGLIQSLLMSTATPLIEEDSGSYYSIMKQGSGLANVENAINSDIVILMDSTAVNGEARKDITAYAKDGKVKAELGDDPERSGKYTVAFTLNNITGEDHYFDLNGDFFTQDLFAYYTFDEAGNPIFDEDGYPVVSVYLDTWTVGLNPSLTWYVNDVKLDQEAEYDFNGDGVFDNKDAKAILDAVAAGDVSNLPAEADLNGDDEITTYDAYLALKTANGGATEVPAYGTVDVRVEIDFGDELKEYDDNGAYVEGYLFVKEKDSEEGVIGIDHSIPVLGYYGSWTDSPMVDIGSVLEYEYGLEYRAPYMSNPIALGANAYGAQAFAYTDGTSTYVLGGNPVDGTLAEYAGTEEDPYVPEYREERNAFSNDYTLRSVYYSLIRNAAGKRIDVADTDGNQIPGTAVYGGSENAAYYYSSSSGTSWRSTSSSMNYGRSLANIKEGTNVVLRFTAAPEYYLDEDKNIVWDDVLPSMELPVMIDNTAPVFDAVFGDRLDTGVLLALSLSDNGYIAGLFVLDEEGNVLKAFGPREDEKTGSRDSQRFVVNLEGDIPDHLLVVAFDYASNATSVEINLNLEELENDIGITLDQHEATSVVGNSIQLSASLSPWGLTDQGIVWTSSDESVATVNANGIVTGVGEGTAVITAAAHADTRKTDTCTVNFIIIEREMNGFVWDENGEVWFSKINTATIPAYQKLSDSMRSALATATYMDDGKLYVASFDSSDFTSTLYTMDEDTLELTEIGYSEFGFMDMCAAPNVGANRFLAVYGPYVLVVNRTTAQYEGAFDLTQYTGGNNLVGIAYRAAVRSGRYTYDYVYLLDDQGTLYNAGYRANGTNVSQARPTSLGKIGKAVDIPCYQSLYYDGTDLYWSRFSESENDVDIIFVEDIAHNSIRNIYVLGSFASGVWPVSGLFNADEKHVIGLNNVIDTDEIIEDDEDAVFLTEIAPINPVPAAGKLDAMTGSPVTGIGKEDMKIDVDQEIEEDGTTVTITLTAEDVTTNGLYEVEFDPGVLAFEDFTSYVDLESVNVGDNKVVFAFADLNGVDAGEVVATIVFNRVSPDETRIAITQKEENNVADHDASPDYVLFESLRRSVVYYDGVNNEVFKAKIFDELVVGDRTPSFGDDPTRRDYIFGGWDPEVSEFVGDSVMYTATWIDDKNNNGIPDDQEDYGDILPEDRPLTTDDIPEGVWISPLADLEYNGKAQKQDFRVYDYKTMLKEGVDYTVAYKNNTKVGTATVTVTGKGNYKDKISKTFKITPILIDVDLAGTAVLLDKSVFVYNGKVQKAKVTAVYHNGVKLKTGEYTVQYEDDNSKEAKEYGITLTFKGNYTGTWETKYRIVEQGNPISVLKVSGIAAKTYTGDEITQDLTVKDGNKTLTEGEDYETYYVDNVNAGTGFVIIYSAGQYDGIIVKPFQIKPAKMTAANTQVSGIPASVEYSGTVEPEAVLTFNNRILKEGEDYTVSYKNNNKAGTATVTFKGIGNFTGSFSKTFKIDPITADKLYIAMLSRVPYEKGGTKPNVAIVDTVNKTVLDNSDFTVTYKNNTKPGTAVAQFTFKGNYTGTAEKTFEITTADIGNTELIVPDKAYSAKKNGWKSAVTVEDANGKKLVAGTDYEKDVVYTYADGQPVSANDTPQAGTVIKVTVTGKGYYTGTVTAEYRIVSASIDKAKVTIPAQGYTGKPVTLSKDDITVKVGTVVLGADDYEIVSYSNNVAKGNATVVLKGVGNYGGTKTVTFKIVQKSFAE